MFNIIAKVSPFGHISANFYAEDDLPEEFSYPVYAKSWPLLKLDPCWSYPSFVEISPPIFVEISPPIVICPNGFARLSLAGVIFVFAK